MDDRNDEAGFDRDRDADVCGWMELDGVLGPERIDGAVTHQGAAEWPWFDSVQQGGMLEESRGAAAASPVGVKREEKRG